MRARKASGSPGLKERTPVTSLFHKANLPTLAALTLITCLRVVADTGSAPPCLISSNFNGTPITGGNYIWFNSVFSLPGFDPSQLTKRLTFSFTGVTITFTANSTPYTVNSPSASITYDPAATTATTTFTPGTPGQWTTTLPTTRLAGNDFLDAAEFLVPPGGLLLRLSPRHLATGPRAVLISSVTPPADVHRLSASGAPVASRRIRGHRSAS